MWKIGDEVELKSGGPGMTVHAIGDYSPLSAANGAKCVWFDGAKKCEEVFDAETLKRYVRPDPNERR